MFSDTLTVRETMILRYMLAQKGIIEYEVVGVESTGKILPGGLYDGEVESFYGYVVTATTVYFFWLDWGEKELFGEIKETYTLGEADDFWQEISLDALQDREQIIQAQQRLQQRQSLSPIIIPRQLYVNHYYTYRRQELQHIPRWEGPSYQQQKKTPITIQYLSPVSICGRHTSPLWMIELSPDGGELLTNAINNKHQTVQIWQTQNGQLLSTLESQDADTYNVISDLAFSPDGKKVVIGYWTKHVARIWNVETGDQQALLQGHSGVVVNVAFSPDGTHVLTGSQDKTARLWDGESGKQLFALRNHQFGNVQVAFSRDGKKMATASWDRTASLWDTATGDLLLTLRGHADAINNIAFSPDSSKVITSSWDRTARLWDAITGELLATLQGHLDMVKSGTFSPDGSLVLTYSRDYMPRLWEVASGRCVAVLEGLGPFRAEDSFSPDGKYIVTSGMLGKAGYVYIWQASGPGVGNLLSIFGCKSEYGPQQIEAVRWLDTQHIVLADKGGAQLHPHIYQASLNLAGQSE
jgi:WD40 repeat protein